MVTNIEFIKKYKIRNRQYVSGYWQSSIGFELKGKLLGLIGLGRIGSQVATIAKAFGMQVCAWSENLDLSHANKLNVLPMTKEDLIKNSILFLFMLFLG